MEAIDCFEQTVRILHFVFDQGPQLFKESTQVFRFFLSLFEFLIEKFFAVT